MIYRFGRFELDEERRELRLDGRELLLQPRVFDLLTFLVRARDRVVGKEELLDALWSDVIVGDGSVQRATSLARSALRSGGLDDAIRTHARQGYRFCLEVEEVEPHERRADERWDAAIERARRAWSECDWETVVERYAEADRDDLLETVDLERWGLALACLGRGAEAPPLLERAAAAHSAVGDTRGAARVALLLSQTYFERTRMAVAQGWHRRALALLAGEPTSAEHGHAEWLAARAAIVEGDQPGGLAHATKAVEIGREIGEVDVETLGLLYQGHALLALGEARKGRAAHDEAAATVLAGGVTPWVGGLVYCGVIWACRNRGDWERAAEWSEQFQRWCESSGMAAYPGTCQLHHAEVLAIQGSLARAESEARKACGDLETAAPWALGDAWRVLGDLQLARGEAEDAERSYRKAHAAGWDPNPGLAALQAAAGDLEGALRSLERSAEDPSWAGRERRHLFLAQLVILAADAGELERAGRAHTELAALVDEAATTSMRAWHARASGELALAREDTTAAVAALRESLRLWRRVGCPLQLAAARLALARALVAQQDRAGADLELAAAEETYGDLELNVRLEHCRELRSALELPTSS